MLKVKCESYLKNRFKKISESIRCLHSDEEAIFIAKSILNESHPGPVVECGCFMGGMTSKMSIACKIAKKELHVYDTFSGLPYDEKAVCFSSQKNRDGKNGFKCWTKGSMCCSLENVMANIKKHGEISCCKFFPGMVENTLTQSNVEYSLAFIDVDLRETAKECIRNIWPRLGGKYLFSHEMWFKDYVEAITDRDWWIKNLDQEPPILIGSENGLSSGACDLGYFSRDAT